MMTLFSCERGKPSVKSIETLDQGIEGTGNGCMSLAIPFEQNNDLTLCVVISLPDCPLLP